MSTELLQTIAVAVITNGAVLCLFIWVFKILFEQALDKRAKLYEKELDLQHRKHFHQFSKLYDEQATALRDAYSTLVRLNEQASRLAFHYNFYEQHPQLLERYRLPQSGGALEWGRFLKSTLAEKPEGKQAQHLAGAAVEALQEFRPRRIFFDAETANEVERLINLFAYVGSEFENVSYRDPKTLEQIIAPEVIETWKKVVTASQVLFPQLEQQFRAYLRGEAT
ncbi:MAG: hypothetical protein K2X67_08385 [Burkholderiales bacterium]|nr:hypothetical protein [Burkholderiales bacterium]